MKLLWLPVQDTIGCCDRALTSGAEKDNGESAFQTRYIHGIREAIKNSNAATCLSLCVCVWALFIAGVYLKTEG